MTLGMENYQRVHASLAEPDVVEFDGIARLGMHAAEISSSLLPIR